MKRWLAAMSLLLVAVSAGAAGTDAARRALSTDRAEARRAVAELRKQGQPGVDALVAAGEQLSDAAAIAHYREILDRLCRQRDCAASHLYWYTDLRRAQAVARAEGKPILSLRLLGNLDEELSCANSRFFRVTLYSNPAIRSYLREHFVLHWQSERPVPKVTVYYGGGRKLLTTLTGNSVHYLLSADGTPLDALPGLYSPDAFLFQLQQLERLGGDYARTAAGEREQFLRNYHTIQWRVAKDQRERSHGEIATVAAPGPQTFTVTAPRAEAIRFRSPTAGEAAAMTMSKTISEAPILATFGQTVAPIESEEWKRMGEQVAPQVRFAPESIALMQEKYAPARSGREVPAATRERMQKMLARLRQSVAEDTVRNEYDLHLRIHEWFASGAKLGDLPTLNGRVYAELFLTPSSDPWLGLLQDDTFSAITAGGVVPGPSTIFPPGAGSL
jgi:hypothetical protein